MGVQSCADRFGSPKRQLAHMMRSTLRTQPAKLCSLVRAHQTDETIARAAKMLPIGEVAAKLGIPLDLLEPHGKYKAKIPAMHPSWADKKDGKLILVTAITPTKAGEGKTTTSVGIHDGLSILGKKSIVTLREPSLGPVFGMKGGAAGGGYAQVVPMDDINLHFTGDFHAIGAAHNLLSAMLDNHIHWRTEPQIDSRKTTWKRVADMNDRVLREVTAALGGTGNGFPRQDGFDITVASEAMAIFCLSEDFADCKRRLGNIIVGQSTDKPPKPVTAKDIHSDGAMTALLKDALQPNLVQTLENNAAIIHGGPFANIAHGCNSVMATKLSLKMADYVVTEAGFGADLGAQKFLDIKCRKAGLTPDVCVMVATVRALKMHGGVSIKELEPENTSAVRGGMANLEKHLENMAKYNLPCIVAINKFPTDTQAEVDTVLEECAKLGVKCVMSDHWANGGKGSLEIAQAVVDATDSNDNSNFKLLYPDDMSLVDKTRTIAQEIYAADDIALSDQAAKKFRQIEKMGFGHYPICIAKTQYSFSSDPTAVGAPTGHTLPIREVRLAAGAEFVVAVSGEIMTMPGLPRVPSANKMGVDDNGNIFGLF